MVSHSKTSAKPDSSELLARECAELAYDKKAENITILNVGALTSYTDCFVVCSASSERQAQAIANHLLESLRKEGHNILGVEGLLEGHWVLLDLGDVVVHVFTREARDYYDLDGLWADAPTTVISDSKRDFAVEAFAT